MIKSPRAVGAGIFLWLRRLRAAPVSKFQWLTPFLGFWFLVSMATPFLCFWFLVSMATPFNFVEGCAVLRYAVSKFLGLAYAELKVNFVEGFAVLGFYGCAVSGFLSFKLFKV